MKDMDEKYVALAIPFFFFLMAVEAVVLRRKRIRRAYRFTDSITNLSCGVGQQVLEPFLKGLSLWPYAWLWEHARIMDVSPRSPLAWVCVILGADLAYYGFHRTCHRVGFLWAIHAVHHQSEEYNLSVALRQPWLQVLVSPLFYLPLAVLGVSPAMLLGAITIDTLYQFWIHTRAIGRLGPLEAVLNTPSHHRVHHGIDPAYLDKNYAGIFIVWDRLFGTFEREGREPVYGTVKASRSLDPWWVNLSGWLELVAASLRTRSWADKVRVWFAPPEWRPKDLGGPVARRPADRRAHPRYDPAVPLSVRAYVTASFVLVAVATIGYLWWESSAARPALAIAALALLVGGQAHGALLERRRWGWKVEAVRLLASAATVMGLLLFA
jgi:alkylglycerol monooxygenase